MLTYICVYIPCMLNTKILLLLRVCRHTKKEKAHKQYDPVKMGSSGYALTSEGPFRQLSPSKCWKNTNGCCGCNPTFNWKEEFDHVEVSLTKKAAKKSKKKATEPPKPTLQNSGKCLNVDYPEPVSAYICGHVYCKCAAQLDGGCPICDYILSWKATSIMTNRAKALREKVLTKDSIFQESKFNDETEVQVTEEEAREQNELPGGASGKETEITAKILKDRIQLRVSQPLLV